MLALVTGGTRSGKSRIAERMVAELAPRDGPVVYVATADAEGDGELAGRIATHRARRPSAWRTVESCDPEAVLATCGAAPVLVDALGPWVARLMDAEGLFAGTPVTGAAGRVRAAVSSFADAAAARAGLTVVVAEESGLGLLPAGPGGAGTRLWLDLAGEAAQALASRAGLVRLVVAGRFVDLPSAASPDLPAARAAPGDRWGLRLHGDVMVPDGALDFAVNVAPGPPPTWLAAAIDGSLGGLARYPDDTAAVRAIADRHGCSRHGVLPLNGSAEAFWLLGAALRPQRAVCIHPSFTEGEAALRAAGCPVDRVFRDPGTFALDAASVPAEADLVLTCNPNNPTGSLDARAALERLARPGRVLVVDEAFIELCTDDESLMPALPPDVVVLRSLTKTWGIPGLRAGYLAGPPDVVAALRAVRQPWAVGGPALAAIEACMAHPDAAREVASAVGRWRAELTNELAGLPGVRVWPGAANFLLLEVPDGPSVRFALLDHAIAVRRCDTFPGLGPHHLRIAVREPHDNRALVAALRRVLEPAALAGRGPA
jgi:histidinol-phosphate aminotransferase